MKALLIVPLFLFLARANLLAGSFTFTTIDLPNSTSTVATGISNNGQVVGFYFPIDTVVKGFSVGPDGQSIISIPNTSETSAGGINNSGIIAGSYENIGEDTIRSFLLSDAIVTQLSVPGFANTVAQAINDNAEVVGYAFTVGEHFVGFTETSGVYSTLVFSANTNTEAFGVNDLGEIVGVTDVGSTQVGFLFGPAGFSTIAFPGALATSAFGINDSGEIVGQYFAGDGVGHGFVFENGIYTNLDVPGATDGTAPRDINDSGEVVGQYNVGSKELGFTATPIPESTPSTLTLLGFIIIGSLFYLTRQHGNVQIH